MADNKEQTIDAGIMADREKLIYNAKLAEQAERYDEMAAFMKECAKKDPLLSTEERNLLSVAYKNAVGARRASWRVVTAIEQKQKGKPDNEENVQLATEYRRAIEKELMGVCRDILDLLEEYLVPKANSPDRQVFFYKMRGDYYRYIAEFAEEKQESAKNAREAYEEAYKVAAEKLQPTHPIYLGLALNYSVFHYEIMNDPTTACSMAQKAFDDAIRELDAVSEENYRDSTLIMQLLRDNLTLWTSDVPGADVPTTEGNDWAKKNADESANVDGAKQTAA